MEDQIPSKTLDLTWVPDGMDPIALTCSTPPTVTSAIFTGEMSGSSNPAQVPSSCSSLDPPSSGSRSLHHEMKEAFDPPTSVSTTPPEIEGGTSSCMRNNIRKDVVAERDSISSYKPYMYPDDSMKLEEDAHFLSHTKMAVSLLDHQAQSLESNYAIDIGSHAYLKDAISPQSEYDRQQSYFSSLSSCSLENSSSLETGPSSPDASVHVLAKIRSNISGPKTDCVASYPTTDHQLRRSYPEYHSEHQYSRSDRCAAFSNCTGQSSEHRDEVVDLPRGAHCVDETTSFSSRWSFDDGEPSLPRGLPYGHEIPSLSTQRCNANKALSPSSKWQYGAEISSLSHRQCYGDEILSLPTQKCKGISHSSQWLDGAEIPSFSSRQSYGDEIPSLSSRQYISRSSQWQYGGQIPSLTSKQSYGDEIPSLSRRWSYQDKIPLYSGQRCHDAEAHRSRNYQQGASHGHGHSRNNYVSSFVSNQQVYMTASKHAVTRPRVANRVVNGTDRCIISKKKNPWRNSEDIRDQVCGPRAIKLNNASTLTTKKDILSPLVSRDQFNRSDFSVQYEHAKFFMIKSYSEDDIHKGIKYNVWASTPNGNNKLDAAFHEAQILMKEKGTECPVFLFFSVNTSGQFVGMAEMLGPVDFKKTMDFWRQDKWNGFFPVIWHIIKDIPNRLFKHITLENNDNRPVTFSRDTQEIGLPQGLELLKIFKAYHHETSILDDFDFYEEKENTRCAQKGLNVDSLHEARLSCFGTNDFKSMGNLEAGMESMSFETWD